MLKHCSKFLIKILCEPLIHFLMVAVVLFLCVSIFHNFTSSTRKPNLIISQRDINNILKISYNIYNLKDLAIARDSLSKKELNQIISQAIQFKILLNNASRNGLSQSDFDIMNLMVQKQKIFQYMKISNNISISDGQSLQYYNKNKRVIFSQQRNIPSFKDANTYVKEYMTQQLIKQKFQQQMEKQKKRYNIIVNTANVAP